MPKLRYTFTFVHEATVSKKDLQEFAETMELPGNPDEYIKCERTRMADDGAEYLDAWLESKGLDIKVEWVDAKD